MKHTITYTEVNPVYVEGRKTTKCVIAFLVFIAVLSIL